MAAPLATSAEDAFDALGDGTRRQILALVAEAPRSVQEIADRLPVSRPAVSQHLKVLAGAGLVGVEVLGTRRFYRLDPAGAALARDYLDQMWSLALGRFALVAENTSPKKGSK